jgi:hypothetical protein
MQNDFRLLILPVYERLELLFCSFYRFTFYERQKNDADADTFQKPINKIGHGNKVA